MLVKTRKELGSSAAGSFFEKHTFESLILRVNIALMTERPLTLTCYTTEVIRKTSELKPDHCTLTFSPCTAVRGVDIQRDYIDIPLLPFTLESSFTFPVSFTNPRQHSQLVAYLKANLPHSMKCQ